MVTTAANERCCCAADDTQGDSGIEATAPVVETNNGHLSAGRLQVLLKTELAELADQFAEPMHVEPLGEPGEGIDSTTKFLIRTQTHRPVAVAIVSRPAAPTLIARGTAAAAQIRNLLGPELGGAIIAPLRYGMIDGRSYELLPWHTPLSESRVLGGWQRFRLKKALLNWLHDATAAAAAAHGAMTGASHAAFNGVLEHLESQAFVDGSIREMIVNARSRLSSGRWQPRHSFDHNDLWMGNVLLSRRADVAEQRKCPFVLIDWAGANELGFGVYDLIRLSQSLRMSDGALDVELHRHARALHCEPIDLNGHLLAAMGRLHQNLEHFPEDAFVQMFHACTNRLECILSRSAE